MNIYTYYNHFYPKRKGIPCLFVVSKAMVRFIRA
jgi:hypothetical protein